MGFLRSFQKKNVIEVKTWTAHIFDQFIVDLRQIFLQYIVVRRIFARAAHWSLLKNWFADAVVVSCLSI